MLEKTVNTILYCKSFSIFDIEEIGQYKQPQPGRVYEAHYSSKNDEYVVRVKGEDTPVKGFSYIFYGDRGKNNAYEYEFTALNKNNIDGFSLHDDDLDIIAGFMSNKASDPIPVEESLILDYEDLEEVLGENESENPDSNDLIEKILGMAKEETNRLSRSVGAMNFLISQDPELAKTVQNLLIFLADQYQNHSPVDLTRYAMSTHGQSFLVGASMLNISNYMSSKTGGNPEDINKAIQFCLYELTRIHKSEK